MALQVEEINAKVKWQKKKKKKVGGLVLRKILRKNPLFKRVVKGMLCYAMLSHFSCVRLCVTP